MTRADPEADLRRNLADTRVPAQYHDAIVSAFLGTSTVHLIRRDLTLACGHTGRDPSSSVLAEVTCGACKAASCTT